MISVDDQPIDDHPNEAPLVLDGFDLDGPDADAAARPVVLLTPKRPSRTNGTGPVPERGGSSPGASSPAKDYVQSLERRLAEDDE